MIHAMNSSQALMDRRAIKMPGSDEDHHWRIGFLGGRADGSIKAEPQAFLIEMPADQVLEPHFHAVDQFQIFVAGSGSVGRNSEAAYPLLLHYADHHTAYGPITSGPHGYSYFTLRPKTDSGAVYLNEAGYREQLKPSRKRHHIAHITLSTEPVLLNRSATTQETLIVNPDKDNDSLAAFMLRMGPRMKTAGPSPRASGGQYYLVLNGSLELNGVSYAPWSTIFVEPAEEPLALLAGPQGLEVLITQFSPQQAIGQA